jgi:hypothetical protein
VSATYDCRRSLPTHENSFPRRTFFFPYLLNSFNPETTYCNRHFLTPSERDSFQYPLEGYKCLGDKAKLVIPKIFLSFLFFIPLKGGL